MNWDAFAEAHRAVAGEVTGRLRPEIEAVAADLSAALRNGGKILVCGNGGSAADAQHLAAELVNRFLLERAALPCIALTTDSSVLTSIANDYDYDLVFRRQVEALARPGDWLVAISTSGQSPGILGAAEAARDLGVSVLALTGGAGGALRGLADRVLCVESSPHTPRIQEGHLMIIHALCELVEAEMAQGPEA